MWAIFFLFILVPLAVAGISFAPWVPTNTSDLSRIQKVLKYKKGEKFLEF